MSSSWNGKDGCQCGSGFSWTGTCASIATRRLLRVGEPFRRLSVTGSEFDCHIRGATKVGDCDAILPTVEGSAWMTGFRQVVLDASDPFQEGFRVGESWHVPE